MSTSAHERALTTVDVPVGPACVDAIWQPLDAALAGRTTIALLPEASSSTPAPVVASMRAAVAPSQPIDEHVAVVLSTSGSTGSPRGVCLGASALTCMSEHVNALAGGDPAWVLAIPPTSIGGLNVLIRARATGRPPVPLASLGGAERFTDVVFASAVSHAGRGGRSVAVSLVPAQLPRLLSTPRGREALASCSLVLVGGAALGQQAARESAAAGIRVTSTYGMTETSGGCVVDGRPLPGVAIRVEDTDGRILIAGPMLAAGYRDGEDEAFADGHLRTQDRGRWNDGRLEILGRLDDIVAVRGVNVDLVAIEDRLRDHPLVDAAIALAIADGTDTRIHVAYVGGPIEHEQLRDWVARTLGAPAAPSASHRVEAFVMTPSGKIDRRGTAAELGLRPTDGELL